MFGLSAGELVIIAIVALLVVGPDKLPDAARSIGKTIRDFRRQTKDLQSALEEDTQVGDAVRELRGALHGFNPRRSVQQFLEDVSRPKPAAGANGTATEREAADGAEAPPAGPGGTPPEVGTALAEAAAPAEEPFRVVPAPGAVPHGTAAEGAAAHGTAAKGAAAHGTAAEGAAEGAADQEAAAAGATGSAAVGKREPRHG